MKVIILKTIDKVGVEGEIKVVADGYARNFLFPGGYAMPVTKELLQQLEQKKRIKQGKEKKKAGQAIKVSKKIKGLTISIKRKANEQGRLYGGIGPEEVKEELLSQGYNIGEAEVLLEQPIKELGSYDVSINFGGNITERIKFKIIKE